MQEYEGVINGYNGIPINYSAPIEPPETTPAQQPEPLLQSAFENDVEELNYLLEYMDLGPLYTEGEEEEEEDAEDERGYEPARDEDLVFLDEESLKPPAYDMRDDLPHYLDQPMPPKYEE